MSEIYEYEGYKLTIVPSELQDMFTGSCKELDFYTFHFLENLKRGFRERVDRELRGRVVVTPMTEREWDDIWNKLQAKLSKEED